MDYKAVIDQLKVSGNFRQIPPTGNAGMRDFSSNDYLGLAADASLQQEFFAQEPNRLIPMTSSASRLLAACQDEYSRLEQLLQSLYGREILLFNSGYHANTGLVPALSDTKTLIVADKLVHASIIDGIKLSGCHFERFRHNDFDHLERIMERKSGDYESVVLIVESVYSMDGDSPDFNRLKEVKQRWPRSIVYVDEAHALGVCGERGLGVAQDMPWVDVIIGTFGKALASQGAFAAFSPGLRDVAVNRCRSFIFSTALPPISVAYTRFVLEKSLRMDEQRSHLRQLAQVLNQGLARDENRAPSHIFPFIVGNPKRAVELSQELASQGIKVLPIRTPTVPPGTDRLRFSLSAAMRSDDIEVAVQTIKQLCASN